MIHDFKPHKRRYFKPRARHEIGKLIILASLAGTFLVFIWGPVQ